MSKLLEEFLTTPFWHELKAIIDSEIDYYRNLYENPKTVSKEKAFEYVCKLQALQKIKKRIIGSGENFKENN